MLGFKGTGVLGLVICGLSLWLKPVAGEYGILTHEMGGGFKCAGVYGTTKEKNGQRSRLKIEFPPEPPSDIAVAVFSYYDSAWIGLTVKDGKVVADDSPDLATDENESGDSDLLKGVHRFTVCNDETINMALCSEVDRGRPLINYRDSDGNLRKFKSTIYADYVKLNRAGVGYTTLENKEWQDAHNGSDDKSWQSKARTSFVEGAQLEWTKDGTLKVTYLINATGYYCVDAASTHDFTARADWANAHGQLPAGEYPKVYVYLVLMIAYIAIALAWAFMSWRVWGEVLPVQNQLFGLICLMAVDMGMNYGFWSRYNASGAPSLVYSVFLVVVDAGRNSLSFFMLLVVSLGWGVVRPSLGKMMVRCILLAAVHFAAGCLYGAGIVFRDPHDSGPLGLIYVVPLSFTMTLFYVWTLSAIIGTTHLLIERQQSYKLNMYNRLWRLLMLSLVLLFVYFVLNVMYTVFYSRPVLAASTWKWRWFWTDGWLNLEYFAVLATILFWWRPTTQNYRFGLEELAGNEEEAMERDQHDERDSFDNPRMGENLELDVIAHPNKGVPVSGDDVQFVVDDDEFNSDDDEDAPHLTEAAAAQKKGYAMAPGGGLVDRSSKADTLFEAPQFSDDDDEEDLASGSTSRAAKKGLKDD